MWSERALALASLIRSLKPASGWYFVASPRGYTAWIYFVGNEGGVDTYQANLDDDAARQTRAFELRRMHADAPHFESLCKALDAESRYVSHARGQGSVPFAQPFVSP